MTAQRISERAAREATASGSEPPVILGADAARRLNAIEGIVADETSRSLIGRLSGERLTAAERRAALKAHFSKAAGG